MRTWMWKYLECRPFRAVAERSFWRGVKLNYIMLKCVNAWQCLRRAQLERVGVGVPGDGGPQNALSAPMFLWLSVSSLLGFLFLVLLLTLTVMIFGFLHLCSLQCKDCHVYVCKMCLSVELSVGCMILKLTLHFL